MIDTYQMLYEKLIKQTLGQLSLENNYTNFCLWVDNKHTCDHLVDASIKVVQYLSDIDDECIGQQISPCIRSKKF